MMRPQWTVRVTLRGLAAVLAATVAPALALPGVARAGEPSVGLPDVPSVPVVKEVTKPLAADPASTKALSGDQTKPRSVLDGAGNYTATSLSPSATWEVSTQTGDFTWTYPLRVPPAPGGLEPELALSYRSSAVDGRTSATNQQPSWIGDGWDLSPGFIERGYGACAADDVGDVTPPKTIGDLCWRTDNATAAFAGGGGILLEDGSGSWRTKNDNGSRAKRLTGAGNGDNDGEHWKITTVDGTQYWFGSQVDSNSTWTVPVFGDDRNEPCNRPGSFDTSHCVQAWRWNLDKVVDRNGNVIRYFYKTESNSYAMNRNDTAVGYTRAGTLERIEYGRHEAVGDPATGRVQFSTADRCVPGASSCGFDKILNWPDTPLNLRCAAATCKDQYAPSFWSTQRLASITTEVWRGSEYQPVDRWTLDQQYPDPGDGEKPALWLKGITHTGLVGGSAGLPAVTFEGDQFANRVAEGDGLAPLNRFRIVGVVSETGGYTTVTYETPDCRSGQPMPPAEANTLRCFPVRWAKPGQDERIDYFHKYVVKRVVQSDRLASSHQQQTEYEYLDGAGWHWNMSEFAKDDKKTWDEFRGYGRVRVRTGSGADGPITMAEHRFYRGMHGDRLPNNGTRSVSVSDTAGGVRHDEDWLNGFEFESAIFEREERSDLPDPPRIDKTISDPWFRGPTATRGAYKAYLVQKGAQRTITALGSGGWRTATTETGYDEELGLPKQVNDLGDPGIAEDDRCATTTYTQNRDRWLMNLPFRVETVSVHCGATAAFPRDAVSDTRNSYDDNGNLTETKIARERPAGGPVYVTTGTMRYDVHGRAVEKTDALGNTTRFAFTPASGGPVTATTVATPPTAAVPGGLVTTTALEPAWGEPTKVTDPNDWVTETAYDPLGRRTQVWLANRPREVYPNQGSYLFSYVFRKDGPTVVTSTAVGPTGVHTSVNTVYDGFLRQRQTQAPAVGGGRLITDTRYDSHGRVFKTTQPYFNDGSVDDQLWVASDAEVPGLTRTEFDPAGRPVASVYQAGTGEKAKVWRTTTEYGGDRITVTPPAGGTPTTRLVDARGRLVELRQHRDAGTYDTTRYRFTPGGQLAEFTTADGSTRRYGYDLRGLMIRSEDPDRGVAELTYDDAGRPASVRDARGVTVAIAHDSLGRRTAIHENTLSGTKLAEWVYDISGSGKGLLAASTRFVGGHAYTTSIANYSELSKPLDMSVTIPEVEGLLAGTYTWEGGYGADGALTGESYPRAGDLRAETVSYRFDDAGRPLTSRGSHGNRFVDLVSDTGYTRYGEVQRIQLGTGTKRAWLSSYYDTNTRRLERSIVDAEVPAPMQSDVHYTHDPAGNVTSMADRTLGQAVDNQCFRYDHLRRLTEAWTPTGACADGPSATALGGPAPYWHAYQLDPAGNRRSETRQTATGATTRIYGYPDSGQPQPHTLRSVTGASDTATYGYDAAGNLTSRTRNGVAETLSWDAEGRLAAVTGSGKTTSLIYTANGNRLLRKDPTGTTLYLGKQEVRLSAAGGSPAATRYYTHGSQTIAVRQGDSLTWLAGDHQGTSQVAINSGTLQVTRRRQVPFGGPRGVAPAWPGERAFVGGTSDTSTGLIHLGAREYDSDIGRFISADLITDPNDPQQSHGYTYANDTPITAADPDGLKPCNWDENCVTGRTDPAPPEPILGSDAPAGGPPDRTGPKNRSNCPDGDTRHCRSVEGASSQWQLDMEAERRKKQRREQAVRAQVNELLGKVRGSSKGSPPKSIEQLIVFLLGELSEGQIQSMSLCFETAAGLVYGVATERCENYDIKGMTHTYQRKRGWFFGGEASFGFSVKFSSDRADKIATEIKDTITVGTSGGLGPFGSMEHEADPDDYPNRNQTVTLKLGVGVGLNFGCHCRTTHIENSGYDHLW